jgi:uncharacterized membrane protein
MNYFLPSRTELNQNWNDAVKYLPVLVDNCMKTKLLYLWEILQSSFWFLPFLIILSAIAVAFGLIYVDYVYDFQQSDRFFLIFSGTVQSARNVLSVIAGAMLSVAGTVFSITLVALTLATSQLGPRLLRNFMHDRINQSVLGIYVATFIYSLIVLHSVKGSTDEDVIPSLAVTFALLLATGSIFLLIIFIHNIAKSIQADYIIADVDKKLGLSLKKIFPSNLGQEPPEDYNETHLHLTLKELFFQDTLLLNHSGYLQAIDNEGLLEIASKNDLFVQINHRPGEFLLEGMPLVILHGRSECNNTLKEQIRDSFILGQVRTPTQDAEFAVNQLVEVAVRALSPGINDPFTAIRCIDSLASNISYLMKIHFPSPYRYDENKILRIKAKPETFAGIMDAAFNQIRQFGKNSPSVIIRLMEALVALNELAKDEIHRKEILRHAEMILNAAHQNLAEESDLKDLEARFKEINAH